MACKGMLGTIYRDAVAPLLRCFSHRRPFAGDGRAMHIPHLLGVEGPGAMHRSAVVPHHQIPLLPFMCIDQRALGGVLDQVAQQSTRLRDRPADDGASMGGQIQ